MLVVDHATERDVSAVSHLASRALAEPYDPQWFLHRLGAEFLVARDVEHGKVVGFAVAEPGGACEGRLAAIAVDGAYRRRGVGSALLRHVRLDLAREGKMRLSLEVRDDDIAAQDFYRRHGFAPEGLAPDAYRDGAAAVRFARPL